MDNNINELFSKYFAITQDKSRILSFIESKLEEGRPICNELKCNNRVRYRHGEEGNWGNLCEKHFTEESGEYDDNENLLTEYEGNCGECGVCLDYCRDGTTKEGDRCNNCYWECRMSGNDKSNVINPDYRPKNIVKT